MHPVEAQVLDPHTLRLREPIRLPPGSTVTITVEPAPPEAGEQAQARPPTPGPGPEAGRESAARPTAGPEGRAPALLAAGQPELRVLALGPGQVYRGEHEITSADWKYSKTREMFFLLLCRSPCSKEQIGVALWPDASPAQLHNNFRVALYHLRRALGHSDWILFENEHYVFNSARPYWFDVELFQRHLAAGRLHQMAGQDGRSAIRHLQLAIDLYGGEFLQSWNAGEWHCPLRRELERQYLDALLLLGGLYAAREQYGQAVDIYHKVIAVDGYLEAAHRELMRCYVCMGERGQALRHFQTYSDTLREELGASPSPETLALYGQLLQGKPG